MLFSGVCHGEEQGHGLRPGFLDTKNDREILSPLLV
ncbi:MAG: hypothetical protein ACJAQT_003936 [Akkermansiaceae bacterium]|jgi:hypothetical protein